MEVLGAGFVAAAVAVELFGVVAGIIYGSSTTSQPGTPFGGGLVQVGPSLSETVQRSTAWASPLLALILFGGIGSAWWQVEGWEDFVNDDESSDSEQDYRTGFRHLLRSRSIATSALVGLAVLAAAVIALVVSTFVLYSGGPTEVISQEVSVLGEGVSTLILAGLGTFAVLRLRASVRAAITDAADEDAAAEAGEGERPH